MWSRPGASPPGGPGSASPTSTRCGWQGCACSPTTGTVWPTPACCGGPWSTWATWGAWWPSTPRIAAWPGRGQLHEGEVSSLLGLAGIPAAAEEVVVARDLAVARLTGGRYHVQHVSTAGTVALIRAAKAEGLAVTAEVAPHHLAFDHTAVALHRPGLQDVPAAAPARGRGRPARRPGRRHHRHGGHRPRPACRPREGRALRGRPTRGHRPGDRGGGGAARRWGWDRRTCSPAWPWPRPAWPAWPAGGSGSPPAAPATITVIDPAVEWVAERFHSRSANSPWRGRRLKGRARHALLRGRFTLRDGEVQW